MNTVTLRHPSGASATILHYGAHMTSWKTADGKERLFLSERAEFKAGVAIRGGVPIIFPQFAAMGSLPKHGFARTSEWHVADRPNEYSVRFELRHSDQTVQIWPFKFTANYTVWLEAESLNLQLSVVNDDVHDFLFTAALHTYLRVSDINTVAVHGLKGVTYRDSTRKGLEILEQHEPMKIAGEVDRIYMSTAMPIKVTDAENAMLCSARGFKDIVIWNPGPALCANIPDMSEQGYRQMLCVEAGTVASPIRLAPAAQWQGEQILLAMSL